ncbi:MAG: hypothetical protein HYV09_09820 [Deltaproteobacteria bacterium]|nr:hypothetical protein [Deltaproteobacteria bacterium]
MTEDRFWPGAVAMFEELAERARAAPQHRAFMLALAAEYFGAFDRRDEALRAIEQAAELPLIDLSWLDRCPSLACVRDDPRFVKARAKVAARAAAVWA